MKNKYRIVSDKYFGYGVQVKKWWFPFWSKVDWFSVIGDTFFSIERAKKYIQKQQKTIYWEGTIDDLANPTGKEK